MNPVIFANIEIGVYNYAIKEATNLKVIKKWDVPAFSTIYMNRLRTIYLNLKNNPDLIAMLRSEELNPRTIAFMTHQEFNPSRWKEMIAPEYGSLSVPLATTQEPDLKTTPVRSRFKISFRVSHPLPSTSFQVGPNCALVYPVLGALPLTIKVFSTEIAVSPFFGFVAAWPGVCPMSPKKRMQVSPRPTQRRLRMHLSWRALPVKTTPTACG